MTREVEVVGFSGGRTSRVLKKPRSRPGLLRCTILRLEKEVYLNGENFGLEHTLSSVTGSRCEKAKIESEIVKEERQSKERVAILYARHSPSLGGPGGFQVRDIQYYDERRST
jgi:hypothetical protein